MGAINEDGSVDYVDNVVDDVQAAEPTPMEVDSSTGEIIDVTPADGDPTADFFDN